MLILILHALFPAYTRAEGESSAVREGKLKAACLYYLAKFVEFPKSSVQNDRLNLCVAGDDILNPYLDSTFKEKMIRNHSVSIVFSEDNILSNTSACNIIYIGDVRSKVKSEILSNAKDKPILTVSSNDITDEGGIIYIMKENNRLKIQINITNAAKSNLKVSSEILQIANIVE